MKKITLQLKEINNMYKNLWDWVVRQKIAEEKSIIEEIKRNNKFDLENNNSE